MSERYIFEKVLIFKHKNQVFQQNLFFTTSNHPNHFKLKTFFSPKF